MKHGKIFVYLLLWELPISYFKLAVKIPQAVFKGENNFERKWTAKATIQGSKLQKQGIIPGGHPVRRVKISL